MFYNIKLYLAHWSFATVPGAVAVVRRTVGWRLTIACEDTLLLGAEIDVVLLVPGWSNASRTRVK